MITSFVVYSLQTGEIKQVERRPAGNLPVLEAGLGYVQTDSSVSPLTHRINLTTGLPTLLPQAPSGVHRLVFNYETLTWVERRTLLEVQNERWAELKILREAFWSAPLSTPYGVFNCDPESRLRITQRAQMLRISSERSAPSTVIFTLANNSTVTLTVTQLEDVSILVGARLDEGFRIGRIVRDRLYATTSIADAKAVVFSET